MAIGTAAKKTRTIFTTANKYQREIILIAFVPSAIIFLTFTCIIALGNPAFSKAIFHTSALNMKNMVNQLSTVIILFMFLIYLLSLIRTYIVSNYMVGAIERIIRELDDVVAGRSHHIISSRPKDTLTRDLVKNINVLIKFYVDHNKKSH
jgi:hypothetical protein